MIQHRLGQSSESVTKYLINGFRNSMSSLSTSSCSLTGWVLTFMTTPEIPSHSVWFLYRCLHLHTSCLCFVSFFWSAASSQPPLSWPAITLHPSKDLHRPDFRYLSSVNYLLVSLTPKSQLDISIYPLINQMPIVCHTWSLALKIEYSQEENVASFKDIEV